jgi:hypothetical protein
MNYEGLKESKARFSLPATAGWRWLILFSLGGWLRNQSVFSSAVRQEA